VHRSERVIRAILRPVTGTSLSHCTVHSKPLITGSVFRV
jgi:hypothetical protein